MYQKKQLSLAVSAALGLSTLVMVPGQVMAQDQQTEEEELLLEEVVVTGSRLVTEVGFGRTSPVTVVGMDAIAETGYVKMEDVLNQLPAVQASSSGNSLISNGATGTASVDLRGLGENRTLVLINGRRMQPGGVYTESPDVNQIPASMVERVEVLTGGASAVYGSDAVAGYSGSTAIGTGATVVLFFCHLFAFGLYAVCVCLIELTDVLGRWRSGRGGILRAQLPTVLQFWPVLPLGLMWIVGGLSDSAAPEKTKLSPILVLMVITRSTI